MSVFGTWLIIHIYVGVNVKPKHIPLSLLFQFVYFSVRFELLHSISGQAVFCTSIVLCKNH